MDGNTKPTLTPKVLEDPLSHLPCSTIQEFRKGQVIYSPAQPFTSIHLVIAGKVKVSRQAETGGREVLIDIYKADEFFGESALIGVAQRETAVALESTQTMTWTTGDIERIAAERPKLAIALLQLSVQRSGDFQRRIESFAVDSIVRRLAVALIRFSERFGHRGENGFVEMMPFTHEVLAQYVGTSREIITHYMNQFRNEGYLRYSRQGGSVKADALQDWLHRDSADHTIAA